MKKWLGLIVLASFWGACSESSKHQPSVEMEYRWNESCLPEEADSSAKEVNEMTIEEENKAANNRPKTVSPSPDRYKSKSKRYVKESGYDNMRGFDPASEDDMDDNGMSRYMENDDDEGWD